MFDKQRTLEKSGVGGGGGGERAKTPLSFEIANI